MGPRKRKVKKTAARPAVTEAARARLAMRALVVLYLFIGLVYVAQVPAGTGPDETGHLRYVQWVAEHGSLPAFDRTGPGGNYEFHQPPLYYLSCLPSYRLGERLTGDAGRAVRIFSLLLALPLLYLTFALARTLAPDRPWLAVATAGIVAFLPMHIYLSACVSNDGLTEVWFAAALLVMVRHLHAAHEYRAGGRERPPAMLAMGGLGLLIGLALLTKSLGVLLLPVAWVVAAMAGRGREGYEWRRVARDVVVCTAAALAVAGWWLVHNQRIYGDPLAQQAFIEAFTRGSERRPAPSDWMHGPIANLPLAWYAVLVVAWTCASVLGMFGGMSGNQFQFFPWWLNAGFALVGLVGLVGWVRYLRRSELPAWQRQAWWASALLGGLLLASFVRFNMVFFQAQARYLFPGALPAAALALSLGIAQLAPSPAKSWAPAAVAAALAALALFGLPLWVLP